MQSIKSTSPVPADAVTTSGSGLDPHITLAKAQLQTKRIALAWARKTQQEEAKVLAFIEKLVATHAYEPLFGLIGSPPLLNVPELNLELQAALAGQR